MSLFQKSNNKKSSRYQIDIKGVEDNVLILPNNEYRVVLAASSVNFELKSEDEQDVLIDTYQSFLNSLNNSLQIIVRVREMDMDKYLEDLEDKLIDEKEEVFRQQIKNYCDFVSSLVKTNRILSRQFYVVIPYHADKNQDFDITKEQLDIRADIVSKGLMRLGMRTRTLTGLELIDLFYSFYSPNQAKSQPITKKALYAMHNSFLSREEI